MLSPQPTQDNVAPISFDDFCKQKVDNYLETQRTVVPIAQSFPNNGSWPPPLPPINDHLLRYKVYTHKSIGKRYIAEKPEEEIEVNNERLEFIGDSVVNTMFALISYEKLPTVEEGDLTACRRQLISNNTLSEWAKMYGMDTELRIDKKFTSVNKYFVGGTNGSANTPKYIADVFEAYVGGLWEHYSNSEGSAKAFDVIKPWLEQLSEPFFKAIYSSGKCNPPPPKSTTLDKPASETQYTQNNHDSVEIEPRAEPKSNNNPNSTLTNTPIGPRLANTLSLKPALITLSKEPAAPLSSDNSDFVKSYDNSSVNLQAKSELYNKIGKATMRPTYEVVKTEPNGYFTVACKINNDVLALATGRNIKIAGNRAAMKVLENVELVSKFAAIRRTLNCPGGLSQPNLNNNADQNNASSDNAIGLQVRDLQDSQNQPKVISSVSGQSGSSVSLGSSMYDDTESEYEYEPTLTQSSANKIVPNAVTYPAKQTNDSSTVEVDESFPSSNTSSLSEKRSKSPVFKPEVVKKYTEDPIKSLKEMMKPIQNKINFEFNKNEDSQWVCEFSIQGAKIVEGVGSTKKTSKKRASLGALLRHYDTLQDALAKSESK